jgi:hypothetical protein
LTVASKRVATLALSLYPRPAIDAALAAFSDTIVLDRRSDDAITVKSPSDDEAVLDEFLNDALIAAIESRLAEH